MLEITLENIETGTYIGRLPALRIHVLWLTSKSIYSCQRNCCRIDYLVSPHRKDSQDRLSKQMPACDSKLKGTGVVTFTALKWCIADISNAEGSQCVLTTTKGVKGVASMRMFIFRMGPFSLWWIVKLYVTWRGDLLLIQTLIGVFAKAKGVGGAPKNCVRLVWYLTS